MSNPKGRPSLFEKRIKSNYAKIEKMIKNGATEEQVAKACGVSPDTWKKYKREKEDFREFVNGIDTSELIMELRGALVKKALGFTYYEKKTITKNDEEGNEYSIIEEYEKYAQPDVAALNLALKNYDKQNWANDPQTLALKQKELELKERVIEEKEW